ncbi:MAG: D-aminoacylase [Burkholderiaceae bacterium]
MPEFDMLFRGAMLFDGLGSPPVRGDLAVVGDRIAAIGDLGPASARRTIDAGGLALAPGFIDAHCHDDRALLDTPDLTPKVSQGVTTVVNGNCGISLAPLRQGFQEPPPPLNLLAKTREAFFAEVSDYFATLRRRPAAVNSVMLCGHTNLRHAVMSDYERAATGEEIVAMGDLLEAALQAGCIGLSTGLFYPPAVHAPTEEIIELARCLAAHGGLYVTHMRDEGDGVLTSLEETFRIGTEAGVPVIVSHHKCVGRANFGRSRETLAALNEAGKHQPVGVDAYPYDASATILQAGRVAAAMRVMVTWSDAVPGATGRDLAEIAAEMGCDIMEAARRLQPGGAIYFQLDESDVRRILADPMTMIGSDGILADRHPHPRGWGTFPRVLGRYCRDEKLFPLPEAIRKMTSLTARRFGLDGRGVLAEDAFADLVLFDAARVADRADYEEPRRTAAGLERVVVNGREVFAGGEVTGERPGRPLGRGRGFGG